MTLDQALEELSADLWGKSLHLALDTWNFLSHLLYCKKLMTIFVYQQNKVIPHLPTWYF